MPVTVNNVIGDSGSRAAVDFCTTGGGAVSESGTIVSAGSLLEANGSGNERIRITKITALLISEDPAVNGGCLLSWSGGTTFCTIPLGYSVINLSFDCPAVGFTGDLDYQIPAGMAMTLRIEIAKLQGFPNTTASF